MKLNDFIDAQLEVAEAIDGHKCETCDLYDDQGTCTCTTYLEDLQEFNTHARNNYRPLLLALKEARETLALMAEGEGPDADVYQQMAKGALATIEALLLAHAQQKGEK